MAARRPSALMSGIVRDRTRTTTVGGMVGDVGARLAKRQLRQRLMANRASRPSADRITAADALSARVLILPEVEAATSVACYVSRPEEPGTGHLLNVLSARGCTVLLPLL